jgi:hypothetical protein
MNPVPQPPSTQSAIERKATLTTIIKMIADVTGDEALKAELDRVVLIENKVGPITVALLRKGIITVARSAVIARDLLKTPLVIPTELTERHAAWQKSLGNPVLPPAEKGGSAAEVASPDPEVKDASQAVPEQPSLPAAPVVIEYSEAAKFNRSAVIGEAMMAPRFPVFRQHLPNDTTEALVMIIKATGLCGGDGQPLLDPEIREIATKPKYWEKPEDAASLVIQSLR